MDAEQTTNRERFDARAREALDDLVRALRRWGSDRDGIYGDAWGAYVDAHYVLGLPIPKPPADLDAPEALYEVIRATNAWARDEGALPPQVVESWRAAHRALGLTAPDPESFEQPDPAVAAARAEREARLAELDEIYRVRRALERKLRRTRRLEPIVGAMGVYTVGMITAVSLAGVPWWGATAISAGYVVAVFVLLRFARRG